MADQQSATTAWALFSAIGGSVVGAALGGVISYLLQRKNLAAAKAQRDDDRLEVRRALAYSLLFKMIRIVSNLEQLKRIVRGQVDEGRQRSPISEPWQVVLPVVNPPDPVRFLPEEMALVLSLNPAVFNQLAAIDELHNSTSALMRTYAEKRASATARFGATMEGRTGTTSLTKEDALWLAPRAVELNELISAILERTEKDAIEAKQALESLQPVFEKGLGLKHKIEFLTK